MQSNLYFFNPIRFRDLHRLNTSDTFPCYAIGYLHSLSSTPLTSLPSSSLPKSSSEEILNEAPLPFLAAQLFLLFNNSQFSNKQRWGKTNTSHSYDTHKGGSIQSMILEYLRIHRPIPRTLDFRENPPPLLQLSEKARLACAGIILDS